MIVILVKSVSMGNVKLLHHAKSCMEIVVQEHVVGIMCVTVALILVESHVNTWEDIIIAHVENVAVNGVYLEVYGLLNVLTHEPIIPVQTVKLVMKMVIV